MVVAIVALFVALSGGALAANRLTNGDKLIKKGTLSGNRLRGHTLTGSQINLNKLGKVPSAAQADAAGSAISATNATDAVTATNAMELGGQPASSYLTSGNRIGTNGSVTVAGTAAGATRTLFTAGPFTVTMTCTTSGGATSITVTATSREANSDLDGSLAPAANTATTVSALSPVAGTRHLATTADFEAPSGARAVVSGGEGVDWPASGDCFANFTGIS